MKPDPAFGRAIAHSALVLATAFTCAHCTGNDGPPADGPQDAPPAASAPRESTFSGAGPLLHAMGFEPGWTLDIYPDSMVYVGRYGEERVVAPRPRRVAESDAAGTTYHVRSGGYEFHIRVTEDRCEGPSGRDAAELTVVLQVDGQEYRGCGTRA